MRVENIKLSDIQLANNSRVDIKTGEQLTLMNSIREKGLLQPVGIRKNPNAKKPKQRKYILNFGYRRHDAVGKLNMKSIPSHILTNTDDSAEYEIVNLVENLHRSNINDYDKGRMYTDMIKKYDLTPSELATRLGVKIQSVNSCVRLIKLVPKKFAGKIANSTEAKGQVKKGKISSSIAKRIIGNEIKHSLNEKQREQMFDWGRQDGVSVKSIDNAFRMMASGSTVTNAIKKAAKIKVVSIDVPVTQASFDKLLREYDGSVADVKGALVDSLYGEGDLTVSRP